MSRAPLSAVIAFLSIFLASCAAFPTKSVYVNAAAGLALKYDPAWTVIQQSQLMKALDAVERKDIPVEDASEAIPNIVFSIGKSVRSKDLVHTHNLMLMVVPVEAGLCSELNSKTYLEQDALEYISSWPEARLAPELNVPVASLQTYTAIISLADRVAIQHRYPYCVNDHYVLMQTTSTTPAGEKELQKLLRTVQIKDHASSGKPH